MSNTPKDGGPAFPHESYDDEMGTDTVKPGLSLRDYFAGQALMGLCAFPGRIGGSKNIGADVHAECAYSYADAMLRVRGESSDDG